MNINYNMMKKTFYLKLALIYTVVCFGYYLTFVVYRDSRGFESKVVQMIAGSKKNASIKLMSLGTDRGTSPVTELPQVSNFTAVIIVAYMRSGSSLTGDILQQHPDAFYMYEPLRSVEFYIGNNEQILWYPDGSRKPCPSRIEEDALSILKSIITCDFSKVPSIVFMDSFLTYSIKWREYINCFSRHMILKENTNTALANCLIYMQNVCLRSKYRIIKTIRVRLADVMALAEDIPEMKIIHLVRDPRATLVSQRRFGTCEPEFGGYDGCSRSFCSRLADDIAAKSHSKWVDSGRLTTVVYENIALEPVKASLYLYNFVGMEYSNKVERYVRNITSSDKNSCAICTVRRNSTLHAYQWKLIITKYFQSVIENNCGDVIRLLGYELKR